MNFIVKCVIFVGLYAVIQAVTLHANLREIIQHREEKPENAEMLKKLKAEIALKRKYSEPYGGEPGKAYFKYFNEMILAPALGEYLIKLQQQKIGNEEQVKLFENLINELGKIRQDMANVTGGEDMALLNNFGLRVRETYIRYESIKDFPAWNTYLHNKLEKLAGKKDGEKIGCYELIDKLVKINGGENFRVEKISDTVAYMGPQEGNTSLGYLQINCHRTSDATQLQLFLAPASNALFKEVAKKFFAVLNAGKVKPEILLEKMASFFLSYSHVAIFMRGQASIGEALLRGLAYAQGYSLSYSKEWTGPSYPSADMHALSTFNESQFIKDFMQNVKLSILSKT